MPPFYPAPCLTLPSRLGHSPRTPRRCNDASARVRQGSFPSRRREKESRDGHRSLPPRSAGSPAVHSSRVLDGPVWGPPPSSAAPGRRRASAQAGGVVPRLDPGQSQAAQARRDADPRLPVGSAGDGPPADPVGRHPTSFAGLVGKPGSSATRSRTRRGGPSDLSLKGDLAESWTSTPGRPACGPSSCARASSGTTCRRSTGASSWPPT